MNSQLEKVQALYRKYNDSSATPAERKAAGDMCVKLANKYKFTVEQIRGQKSAEISKPKAKAYFGDYYRHKILFPVELRTNPRILNLLSKHSGVVSLTKYQMNVYVDHHAAAAALEIRDAMKEEWSAYIRKQEIEREKRRRRVVKIFLAVMVFWFAYLTLLYK